MRPALLRFALALGLLQGGCAAAPLADRPAPIVIAPPVAAPEPIAPAEPPPSPSMQLVTWAPPSSSAEDAPAAEPRTPLVPRERTRITVLAYHFFGGPDSPLTVSMKDFEAQMRWLADHHVTTITVSDLVRFLDGEILLPERVAALIIDDGSVTAHSRAFPVLRRYGIRFTLALNTAVIEKGSHDALTWAQAREMVASGLGDIASHSHTHERMDRLADARNRLEAERSRAILTAQTGVRPAAFVFPFGGHSTHVRRVIEDTGYRVAFGVGGRAVEHDSPRFRLPRVGITKETTLTMFAALFSAKAPRGKLAL